MTYERPPGSRVKHGDPTCADYGCKRTECLKARRDKQKRNKYLRVTGRPGVVGPARAAAHIARFRAAGLPDKDIMQRLQVTRNTFYRIMRGLDLSRAVEQRILAVPVPEGQPENQNLAAIDATGAHRRLQALVVMGWPAEELARRLAVHDLWLVRTFRRQRVSFAVAARVRDLYDELWNARPELHGVCPAAAEEARLWARVEGWGSPLAWDEETIDDPSAQPALDAEAPAPEADPETAAARWLAGESVILGTAARRVVIRHLMEWTADPVDRIAARLEMSPEALSRSWERIKKRERDAGRRAPWRRAYLTAQELGLETEMSSNEMEKVA